MANPLTRVVMRNIADKVIKKQSVQRDSTSNNNLKLNEESLLINLINKKKKIQSTDIKQNSSINNYNVTLTTLENLAIKTGKVDEEKTLETEKNKEYFQKDYNYEKKQAKIGNTMTLKALESLTGKKISN